MDILNNLSSREKKILVWASPLLFLILLFLLVIEPVQKQLEDTQLELKSETDLLEYMTRSVEEMVSKRLIGNASLESNTTPFILLDQNVKRINLPMPDEMEPKGTEKVSFKYNSVSFDRLMLLIQNLEEQGLYLIKLNAQKVGKGLVNCHVTLEKI